MGCDIHMHIEVKYKGRWRHYSAPDVDRRYALFSKMADVRNVGDIQPISQPKGLPDELDEITLLAYRLWDGDAHSESWLSSSELAELMVWWDAHKDQHGISDPFGYVFGNEIDSIVKYPKDFERLRGLGLEDVRAVFWFDN